MNVVRVYKYFPTGKFTTRRNLLGHVVLQEIHEQYSFVYLDDEPTREGKFKAVDLTPERLLALKCCLMRLLLLCSLNYTMYYVNMMFY